MTKQDGYFGSFEGELFNTILMEILIAAAIWKTWFSAPLTTIYIVCGILLVLVLIRAKRTNTKDAYADVGKIAFAIFILDTFITLLIR